MSRPVTPLAIHIANATRDRQRRRAVGHVALGLTAGLAALIAILGLLGG